MYKLRIIVILTAILIITGIWVAYTPNNQLVSSVSQESRTSHTPATLHCGFDTYDELNRYEALSKNESIVV